MLYKAEFSVHKHSKTNIISALINKNADGKMNVSTFFKKFGIFLNSLFHFMNKISTYYHAFVIKIKNEIQIALSDHFVRRFHIFLHKHVPKKENQNYQNVYSRCHHHICQLVDI